MAFRSIEVWAEFQEAAGLGREWLDGSGYSFRRPARERLGTWADAVFRQAYFRRYYRLKHASPEGLARLRLNWTVKNRRVRETPELWEKHKAYQRAYRQRPRVRAKRAAWRKANRAKLREALRAWRRRRRTAEVE